MNNSENNAQKTGGGLNIGLLVALAAAGLSVASYVADWPLAFLLSGVVVISVAIWQACDPFAEAAQYIGRRMHIPPSVRGATLDAIASSMPELFSGIFFVVTAFVAVQSTSDISAMEHAGAEGLGSTIATCAGSAVYNMMLIPAIMTLVVVFCRRARPTIDVENEVLARDGLWFLACELVLLGFLFQDKMHWWMGLVFIGMYVVYVGQLYFHMRTYRRQMRAIAEHLKASAGESNERIMQDLDAHGVKAQPKMVESARRALRDGEPVVGEDGDEEETPESAEALFGFVTIPLNLLNAWLIIAASTTLAAVACYYLVEATRETAALLNVPTFFVAVILTAAASSVPDTFLSIGAARRGDDSGAVSNAFGSNIFDICICLSIPLLVSTALAGWEPVALTQDGKPIPGLLGLRMLLWILTALTLAIMWHRRQLTWGKALVLCGLYLIFIAYAVAGSLGIMAL